jgi:hypothetical protein
MAEAYLFKAVAIREAACRLRRSARRVGTLRLEDPELLPGDRDDLLSTKRVVELGIFGLASLVDVCRD